MKAFILVLTILLYSGSAFAQTPTCLLTGKNQININFYNQGVSLATIKSIMDTRVNDIKETATDLGIETVEMQSINYNLRANNPGQHQCAASENLYRLNGNMSFNIEPSEKAIDLLVQLDEKGYSGGLNVNKHRRCR